MFMFGCWSGSVLEHGSWFLPGVDGNQLVGQLPCSKKKHDHLMTTGRLFVAGARWSNYQFRPAKKLENTDSSFNMDCGCGPCGTSTVNVLKRISDPCINTHEMVWRTKFSNIFPIETSLIKKLALILRVAKSG